MVKSYKNEEKRLFPGDEICTISTDAGSKNSRPICINTIWSSKNIEKQVLQQLELNKEELMGIKRITY
jgi:hypothetical protein